jgi:type I restriction enzyme S subunit
LGDVTRAPRRFEPSKKIETRKARPGDIFLEVSGGTNDRPTGRSVIITQHLLDQVSEPVIPASFCRLIRIRSDVADPRYVYQWLRQMHASGRTWEYQVRSTGIANFQFEYFLDAERVRLPEVAEQRAIAGVLGALDDKIESNRRLSSMCRELVRLELDVRQSDEWPTVPVSSFAAFVNGGAYTKGATGTGRMVIRIAELNKGPGGSTVYNDIEVPEDRTARAGDLLMAWSGSLGIHLWLGPEAIVNQHIFKVLPNDLPAWLVFDRLERAMPEFRQIAADKATTMGHIKRHHLDDAQVRIPGRAELPELDALIGPHWSRALSADLESRTLAELRDALLPELLSGRLRVPVAEEIVESAT